MVDARLRHVGVYTNNIEAMVSFYSDLFGMVVTDDGHLPLPGEPRIVFLSAHADEHHELALVDGGGEERAALQQISFEVESAADLRAMAARLAEEGRTVFPVDHCVSWSIYTPDPDGNLVELYTKTPWFIPQPIVDSLDIEADDDAMTAHTLEAYQDRPGFISRESWVEDFEAKIAEQAR